MTVKKFTINCDYAGQLSPTTVYIGNPKEGNGPLYFQQNWLSTEKGGVIPAEINSLLDELKQISIKNSVDFPSLCAYALVDSAASEDNAQNNDNA